jgi:hypothetical protein
MLKKILKTYGRHRPDELITALLALSFAELVQGIVKLFTSGELRFTTKRRVKTGSELCEQFAHFHATYPHVAEYLLRAAQLWKEEQHGKHYSIGALTEQCRWDARVGVVREEGDFKIPNELRALYARLLVMRDPSLCGLFKIKESVVDDLLVIDGHSWAAFAKEHHAGLWPPRKNKALRKPPARVGTVPISMRREA